MKTNEKKDSCSGTVVLLSDVENHFRLSTVWACIPKCSEGTEHHQTAARIRSASNRRKLPLLGHARDFMRACEEYNTAKSISNNAFSNFTGDCRQPVLQRMKKGRSCGLATSPDTCNSICKELLQCTVKEKRREDKKGAARQHRILDRDAR